MEGMGSVWLVVLVCLSCASDASFAVSSDLGEDDGVTLDLLLAHLAAFESRMLHQMALLQRQVVRSRADVQSLAERVGKLQDSVAQTDAEISANLEQVKNGVERSAQAVSARLQAVKGSLLSSAPTSRGQLVDSWPLRGNQKTVVKRADQHGRIVGEFEVAHYVIGGATFSGTWFVLQRREIGDVDFNRDWAQYRDGFGDIGGDHWLGLQKLHMLVSSGQYELLIFLQDFEGTIAVAHYDRFAIEDERSGYRLKSLGAYSGTAGDSLREHEGMRFSTRDRDHDNRNINCAEQFKGGWWFNACYSSFLNGVYLRGQLSDAATGVEWVDFKGHHYSLKKVAMLIRRV